MSKAIQSYVTQLVSDIKEAQQNLPWPYIEKESYELTEWLSPDEDEATAAVENLPVWTGITPEMLPPQTMLADDEVELIVEALQQLLITCNCHYVLQTEVPIRFQYESIRQNWNQDVKILQWGMSFFKMCKPDTPSKSCALGEYCQCAFYDELFKDMIVEDLSTEEERERVLTFEIQHLQRKYGSDWMKYYPYHLDKDYDDENGNPFNYGFEEDEDDEDNWWRE